MSRKKKVLIIFQLCFAFAFLCWLLFQPYVKQVVAQKSESALYSMVMERQAYFQELSPEIQSLLENGYKAAQSRRGPSLLHEMGSLFFVSTPSFALAWLFFSLVICILLLFRIEGAAIAAWLLPIITLCYAYCFYSPSTQDKESLFPSEEYVLSTYVEASEKKTLNRRESLLLGWHRFLINEWAHEPPSSEKHVFQEQLDHALFAFNAARLKWIIDGKGDEIVTAGFTSNPSVLRLACYFTWNLFFAWYINRKEKLAPFVAALNKNC